MQGVISRSSECHDLIVESSVVVIQHTTPLPERAATSSKRARSEHNPEDESLADFIYMGFPSRTFDAFPMLGA